MITPQAVQKVHQRMWNSHMKTGMNAMHGIPNKVGTDEAWRQIEMLMATPSTLN